MIERLRSGGMTVSQLAAPLPITLAAVGKHIAVLEAAHIIQTAKSGRVRRCELVPESLTAAGEWIARHERFWNSGLDSLVAHLRES